MRANGLRNVLERVIPEVLETRRHLAADREPNRLGCDDPARGGSALKLGINLNADFSSSYIPAANLDPRTRQDSYIKMGARLSLGHIDDTWSVALIGRNLTNERIRQTAGNLPLATTITGNRGVAYNAIYDRPRNIAVSLDFKF